MFLVLITTHPTQQEPDNHSETQTPPAIRKNTRNDATRGQLRASLISKRRDKQT